MDRIYLMNTLDLLQKEKSVHDKKFAGNPVHANCLPNFERAIEKLKNELAKQGVPAEASDKAASS